MKEGKIKDSREYYEYTTLKYKKGARLIEVLVGILVVIILGCWVCWPAVLAAFIGRVLKANEAGVLTYIILIVCGVVVYILNILALFKIADTPSIRIFGKWYDPFEKERYYFNIPKAYEKISIVSVTDGKLLDEFYQKGAVHIRKNEINDNYLSYVYNLINDNYDLHGETLTIYKISPEIWREHYTFYRMMYDYDLYVLPVSVFGMSTEEYQRKRQEADTQGKQFGILDFWDYGEKVEGVSFYRKKSYAYKEEVAKFYEK